VDESLDHSDTCVYQSGYGQLVVWMATDLCLQGSNPSLHMSEEDLIYHTNPIISGDCNIIVF